MESPDASTDQVADTAARCAALILANGGSASEVAGCAESILRASDVQHSSVHVSFGQVAVDWTGDDGLRHQRVERVAGYGFDYGVVTTTMKLVEAFVEGRLSLGGLRTRIEEVPERSQSWSTPVVLVAVTLAGAAAPLIFGGGWLGSIVGGVAYPVLMFLVQLLGRLGWVEFFTQVASGVLASGTAAVARLIDPQVDPTSMVIAVIIIMMAGMTSTGAVRDAITGYYLIGLGRIFIGLVNTVGLVAGSGSARRSSAGSASAFR